MALIGTAPKVPLAPPRDGSPNAHEPAGPPQGRIPEATARRDSSEREGDRPPSPTRRRGPWLLNWLFTAFNSVRILTYLPNIWAIVESGQSGQHSLLTWVTWVGANATMAAWLYENNGRRFNKAVAVSMGNALMCTATCVVICVYRLDVHL